MNAKIAIGIGILLITSSLQTLAQATANVNIYAQIVSPIEIRNTKDFQTVEIVVSNKNTTIGIGAEKTLTASGILLEKGGSVNLTYISVTDNGHSTFNISVPSEKITIGDGTSDFLAVSNFNISNTLTGAQKGHEKMITVSAHLNIPENDFVRGYETQTPFPVTINYN